jgi:hypothetical protein
MTKLIENWFIFSVRLAIIYSEQIKQVLPTLGGDRKIGE